MPEFATNSSFSLCFFSPLEAKNHIKKPPAPKIDASNNQTHKGILAVELEELLSFCARICLL